MTRRIHNLTVAFVCISMMLLVALLVANIIRHDIIKIEASP